MDDENFQLLVAKIMVNSSAVATGEVVANRMRWRNVFPEESVDCGILSLSTAEISRYAPFLTSETSTLVVVEQNSLFFELY